ncbi:NACHT domain-containing protein [Pseudomonas sp. TE3610]
MDYDFSRLSTRSFEQMIQSLALAVLGGGVNIFGDGPDGGREAAFDDIKSFPHPDSPWSGYGVIQAKFRQRAAPNSGAWAVKELRAELTKLSKMSGVKKPEYYIFVTNVPLSPVAGTGGKDKVSSLIDKYKGSIGIRDFRVWDYDQLCAFLDLHPAVRTAYRAWITPGDVLAAVIEGMRPKGENFRDVMLNFVQKELRGEQYVNLGQAGHNNKDRIPLASVFVDLPIQDAGAVEEYHSYSRTHARSEESNNATALAKLSGIASQLLDGESLSKRSTLLTAALTRHPGRIVFIGGPGQGKSTLTQFFCQLHRCSFIRQHSVRALTSEVEEACNIIVSQSQEEGIEAPGVARFPLRIELNRFAASLANGGCSSLFGFVLNRIKERSERDIGSDDLRGWLSSYPWLIALDGLDEVPASSNRSQVLGSIQDFLIDAAECNADILLVATSRPQGYDDDFSQGSYTHYKLSELDADRALSYAEKLIVRRWGEDEDKVQTLLGRMQRACEESSTVRLMKSPLQVTIMALLVESLGEPPKERWRLFNEYYHVINRREKEREIPAAKLLNSYQADIDFIHQKVGVYLQVESERSGKTDALLTEEEFSHVIDSRLLSEGHSGDKAKLFKAEIIEAAIERLVFLVAPQEGRIGFEIRSLQEFMAAQAITSGRDEEIVSRLRSIAHASHWRNVFLFAAGRCFYERQYLRASIFSICSELNEEVFESRNSGINNVLLTGSELALDLVEDGVIANQPSQLKIFTRLALRLIEQPPSALLTRLSSVYQLEVDDLFQESIRSRLGGADFYSRLGAWHVLVELAEREVPWAVELVEKEWPSNPKEVLAITARKISRDPSGWLTPKWYNAVLESSPGVVSIHYLPGIHDSHVAPDAPAKLEPPEWYDVVVKAYNGHDRREFVVEGVGDQFLCVRSDHLYELELCSSTVPPVSVGWKWVYDCSAFTANLNKESLAQIIFDAAKLMRTREIFGLGSWVWGFPWQISAIVRSTDSADELERIGDCILDGMLGDTVEWLEAERRWGINGITRADFKYQPKNGLPFDDCIASVGIPVFALHGDTRADEYEPKIVGELLALYDSGLPRGSRRLIASGIMVMLSMLEEPMLLDFSVCDRLSDIFLEADAQWFDLRVINFIPPEYWEHPGMVTLMETMLDCFERGGDWVYDALDVKTEGLENIIKSRPDVACGVILLSKLCLVNREIGFSASLDLIESAVDPALKEAYIIIALCNVTCEPQEAARMAHIIDEMAHEFSKRKWLFGVLEVLGESNVVTAATESFLYNLLGLRVAEGYSVKSRIIALLKQHQKYHLSLDADMLR